MGQSRGTYHQLFEDVHAHAKTFELAAKLEDLMPALAAVPGLSRDMVVAQLHRIGCWACRESETGRVGHLPPVAFAQIMQWPDLMSAQGFRDAWHSSGFIDDGGSTDASLHEWEAYASDLLKSRRKKRAQREAADPACPPKSPDVVPGLSRDKEGTSSGPHGRASEDGRRNTEDIIPSRGGAGSADADPAREGEASKPKAKRRAKAKPKADDDQPKAPTSDWVDLWRAKHEAAGSEVPINRSEIGMLLATLNRLWAQWVASAGLDPAASAEQATASVEQLIDHWFASQLGARRGYSVKFFCDTGALNQLLGELRAKAEGRPAPGSTGARLTYSEERDQRRREFTRTHRNDLYLKFLEPEPEGESQSQRTARFERAETLAALEREEMKKRGDSDGRFQGKRLEIA